METIYYFIFRYVSWKRVRIQMFLVSSWTNPKTLCRIISKMVQCFTLSAYLPQFSCSMASTFLRRSCSNRVTSSYYRYYFRIANLSLIKISSKFFKEPIRGILVLLGVFLPVGSRLLRLSAERIFLVMVTSLLLALRQYFFLLISARLCLIWVYMCWKSKPSRGEWTFSEVVMKEEMMELLISMLYFDRSSLFSSERMTRDYGLCYFLRRCFGRWRRDCSQILVNWRERMAYWVFLSRRFRVEASGSLSIGRRGRGSIEIEGDIIFYIETYDQEKDGKQPQTKEVNGNIGKVKQCSISQFFEDVAPSLMFSDTLIPILELLLLLAVVTIQFVILPLQSTQLNILVFLQVLEEGAHGTEEQLPCLFESR